MLCFIGNVQSSSLQTYYTHYETLKDQASEKILESFQFLHV